MFKKRKRKDNVRKKRSVADDEGDGGSVTVVRKKQFSSKLNSFSTGGAKRPRSDDAAAASSASSLLSYASTRDASAVQYAGGATAYLETETAQDRDARAILEKNIALNASGAADDGTYRGQAGARNLFDRSKEQISKSKISGTMGPIRAPVFVRSTARFDYEPDVCKDFKDTGYCGYGDNCKFLHDRSDHKKGWQLEQEFEAEQKRKKAALAAGLDPDAEDDGAKEEEDTLPFACHICRKPFTKPVVTRCGHYFNEKCAIKRYAKTSSCAVCGEQTNGIFNSAKKLLEQLAAKAAREQSGGS